MSSDTFGKSSFLPLLCVNAIFMWISIKAYNDTFKYIVKGISTKVAFA